MNRSPNETTRGSDGNAWRDSHVHVDARITARLERAATRYARGTLPASELAEYVAHLERCEVCSALVLEQRHVDDTGAALLDGTAHDDAALTPSAEAWDAIEEHVARSEARRAAIQRADARAVAERNDDTVQPWKSWDAVESSNLGAPGLSLVAMGSGAFEPTATAGIATRRLGVDQRARRVSMFVKMEPGAIYPAHRHGGVEECYVIAGDLRVGDVIMRGGDYQRAEADSVHPVQSTSGGCLLLVTSSLDDELIGDAASDGT